MWSVTHVLVGTTTEKYPDWYIGSGKTCSLVSQCLTHKEKGRESSAHLGSLFLTRGDVTSSFKHLLSRHFPQAPTIDWTVELWASLNPFSLKLPFPSSDHFLKAVRKGTKMPGANKKCRCKIYLCAGLACSLDTLKDKYGRSWVWIQLRLYREFQGSIRLQHQTSSEREINRKKR